MLIDCCFLIDFVVLNIINIWVLIEFLLLSITVEFAAEVTESVLIRGLYVCK